MLRIGILGTGFGAVHARIYQRLPNVEIAGIFGRTSEKLQELHVELGVPVTTSCEALFDDPAIDMIDVCLPTPVHREYVIKALQHQKHVFCETPVSYSLEDARAMQEAARRYGKQVFVGLFFKFSPPHRYATQTIRSGLLGRPLVITASQKTPPHWGDMNVDALVRDFMLHNFDFVTELVGLPQRVMAEGIMADSAYVVSTLHYHDTLAVVESTSMLPKSYPFHLAFTIVCEKGALEYDGQFGEHTTQRLIQYVDGKAKTVALPELDDYEETIKHILECVATHTFDSPLSIDAAIQSLRLVQATQVSVHQRKAVTINL